MKKIGKIIIALLAILIVCAAFTNANTGKRIPRYREGHQTTVFVYVDPETGVNYLIYSGYKSGGITTRLNKDGSPMITK